MQLKFSDKKPTLKISLKELHTLLEGNSLSEKWSFGGLPVVLNVIPHGEESMLTVTNSKVGTVFQVAVSFNHLNQMMTMGRDKKGISAGDIQLQVDMKGDTR